MMAHSMGDLLLVRALMSAADSADAFGQHHHAENIRQAANRLQQLAQYEELPMGSGGGGW